MKTELVNFVDSLSPEVFSYNLELDEGLYILVDLDDEGALLSFKKGVYKKNNDKKEEKQVKKKVEEQVQMELNFTEPANLYKEHEFDDIDWKRCKTYFVNSKMLTSNKRYNQSFEIGSPFGIGFKKEILFESIDSKSGKIKGYTKEVIKGKIKSYFEVANNLIDKADKNHSNWTKAFEKFCLKRSVKYIEKLLTVNKSKNLFVFLNSPDESDYENTHKKYLSERGVFNDPASAIEFNDRKYQVSDTLNGFGIKKIFLEHKTAPFNLNMLITEGEAVSIWKFFELVGNNVLPNPLPIFIDEAELPNGEKIGEKINKEVIRVIQEQGERKLTYSQILKKIYDTPTYRSSLSNYYLMFFQFISQKGFRVIDLDFVPSFQYEIKDMAIEEIFPLGGTQQKIISNIFEFEREVVSKIFDGILVSTFENGGLTVRYFFDFADKQSKNLLKGLIDNLERKNKSFYSLLPQVLKYRKAFYDYIYKSKREAIRSLMFHDIMLKGVMDDLRVSTLNNDKEYDLKIKLNIWFSLYYHFDNPKNYKSMTQEQLSLLERTRKIGQQDNERLETDTEFAFAVGQLVRYLLSKSEAGDRTHALLEPFLQKSDIVQLKLAIARAFGTYKHAIAFYKGDTRYTFDRLMDNVMNYPQTAINLKELLPYILGGYFAESVFKKQIEQ